MTCILVETYDSASSLKMTSTVMHLKQILQHGLDAGLLLWAVDHQLLVTSEPFGLPCCPNPVCQIPSFSKPAVATLTSTAKTNDLHKIDYSKKHNKMHNSDSWEDNHISDDSDIFQLILSHV